MCTSEAAITSWGETCMRFLTKVFNFERHDLFLDLESRYMYGSDFVKPSDSIK